MSTSPVNKSTSTTSSRPVWNSDSRRPEAADFTPIGRIPAVEVSPVIEDGRWAAKATVGEPFPVRATVFGEGHNKVGATAHLTRPDGTEHSWVHMGDIAKGLDRFEGWLRPDEPGYWTFRVEAWFDPYGTWARDATIKIAAGVDVELMLDAGVVVMERTLRDELPAEARAILQRAVEALKNSDLGPSTRLQAATGPDVAEVLTEFPLRDSVSPTPDYPIRVDRQRALFGAWYEIFPRSIGAWQKPDGTWKSGTLQTASDDLPRIADLGFDVVYLTPIHPIGTTNRKGKNNTLAAEPGDPGSPYAIGAADGGHDAIHSELGTFADFDRFVARARGLGMEVALDLALQASPDHPWVKSHPEWFTTRVDGTIAFAENPPKKYEDIYPLNFDNDPQGIYNAVRDVIQTWIDHGVTLFRVDNPHTKPLDFWQALIADVYDEHPDVIFLSEAFTRPAMMRTLGAIGFQQSYTYFTWRIDKEEIEEYLMEVSHETDSHMRPSFWPTTHDILTPFMTNGGASAFALRAVLAATGAPTWGIYTGYEHVENVPRPGAEEQIDNEKYEYRPRDRHRDEAMGIAPLLRRLNAVRNAHPSLQLLRNVTIHPTNNDHIVCFSKHVCAADSPTGHADTIIVVINLDPHSRQVATIDLDVSALHLAAPTPYESRFDAAHAEAPITFRVRDELTADEFAWDSAPYVDLYPGREAHILTTLSS